MGLREARRSWSEDFKGDNSEEKMQTEEANRSSQGTETKGKGTDETKGSKARPTSFNKIHKSQTQVKQEKWSEVKRSEVKVKWGKRSEVKWSEVKWSEAKGEVKQEAKWSEVERNEKILVTWVSEWVSVCVCVCVCVLH